MRSSCSCCSVFSVKVFNIIVLSLFLPIQSRSRRLEPNMLSTRFCCSSRAGFVSEGEKEGERERKKMTFPAFGRRAYLHTYMQTANCRHTYTQLETSGPRQQDGSYVCIMWFRILRTYYILHFYCILFGLGLATSCGFVIQLYNICSPLPNLEVEKCLTRLAQHFQTQFILSFFTFYPWSDIRHRKRSNKFVLVLNAIRPRS